MPCKIPIKSSGETCRSIGKRKTKYACIVDAYHEDHIAAKGMSSLSHYNLVEESISLTQEDTEFKETIKNAREKLETSVAPAMPCKIMKNCGSCASNKIKTKLARILEADESTRLRMENSIPDRHEGPYCRKRREFITALQFGS